MNGVTEPNYIIPAVVGSLIPIAGIAFVTIAVWLGERRKEREAFYRSEVLKKIADSEGDAAQEALNMIRRQDLNAQIQRREGIKLAGLITMAGGIGLAIFLAFMEIEQPVWLVGVMAILVGAALAGYAFFFAPKLEKDFRERS
jgi:hypothetical protein